MTKRRRYSVPVTNEVIVEKIENLHKLVEDHSEDNKDDFNAIKLHLTKLNGTVAKNFTKAEMNKTKIGVYTKIGGALFFLVSTAIFILFKLHFQIG